MRWRDNAKSVIARLDRATQYTAALSGILGPRLRGDVSDDQINSPPAADAVVPCCL